jgi:ribosome-associated toxin RatA of RatAB toxin-antitoxin module
METSTAIDIAAPPEVVYRLAAATEEWPRILPHYRWVKRLRGDDRRKVVEMAAWRDLYPVRWVAVQRNDPDRLRITFTHLRGPTRGMDVEWRLTPTPAGTHVVIWHQFESHLPLIGSFFARRIVGDLFIADIATKTLRRIKALAEARTSAEY